MEFFIDKDNICVDTFELSKSFIINDYIKLKREPLINDILNDNVNFIYNYNFKNRKNMKFINDSYYNISKDNYVSYIRFCINNKKYKKVVLTINSNNKKTKIWINNKYISFINGWFDRLLLELDIGPNLFLIEIENFDINNNIKFYFNNYEEIIYNKEFVIKDDYYDIKKNNLLLDKDEINSNADIEFNILCNDSRYRKDEILINIFIDKINEEIFEIEKQALCSYMVNTRKFISINLREIIEKYPNINYIYIGLNPNGEDNYNSIKELSMYTVFIKNKKDVLDILIKTIDEYYLKYSKKWMDSYFISNFNRIKSYLTYPEVKIILLNNLLNDMMVMFKCQNFNGFIYKNGIKEITFNSILDDKVYYFNIFVPLINDYNKSLPVLFLLSSNTGTTYLSYYAKYCSSEILIVECSMRGATFGNYISEVTFFEVFNKVKQLFRIDMSRIFIGGYSSNGAAALMLSSRYPDIFAGCLAVAGIANNDLLINCSNNIIISICGNKDSNLQNIYTERLEKSKNIHNSISILIDNFDHNTISIFLKNNYIINYLLSYKKCFIKEFNYLTDNLYYNKINFIEIYKIKSFYDYAFIKVIYEDDTINIYIKNIEIFKVIKNKIDFKKIRIFNINNKYDFVVDEDIVFKVSNNDIHILNNYHFDFLTNGLGLLNIFLGPLKLWVESIEIESELNFIKKPKTLSLSQVIYIDYPLFESKGFPDMKCIETSNHVFLNFDISDYIINDKNYIQPLKEGFIYLGKFYKCDYSIIQIVPNIFNEKYFCMLINYNNLECYKKNFFTRNIIIPSDVFRGKNYYKNVSIIYMQNNYYAISTYGNEIYKLFK